jgi:hypothetical protein
MDSNRRRALVLGAASSALVGGTGCFTMLVGAPLTKTITTQEKESFTDTIQALGRPDASLLKELNIPDAIVFLGLKHAYFLVEGGDKLFQIAIHPDLIGDKFDIHSRRDIYIKDDKVWGRVLINYGDKKTPLASHEISALKSLGFTEYFKETYFGLALDFRGGVYPAIDLAKAGVKSLGRTYDLIFMEPGVQTKEIAWDGVAELPLTLALDVVTAPLQVMGFILFLPLLLMVAKA